MGCGPLLCEKIHPNRQEAKQRENKSAVGLGARAERWAEVRGGANECVKNVFYWEMVLEQPDCL